MSNYLYEPIILKDYNPILNDIPWGISAINALKVWEHTKGEGIKVAIIDTGIDTNNNDLKNKIVSTYNTQNKKSKEMNDEFGHGTAIAGIIAGNKYGVAPNVELYVTNSLNREGYGTVNNLVDGIAFAVNSNVDIICLSLGMYSKLDPLVENRLKTASEKGIIIVCATGNTGTQIKSYPSAYDFVISVGGIEGEDLNRANFSSYGFHTDVVAPARDILSTYKNNQYALMNGTSFASPFVAGGIALIQSYWLKNHGRKLTNKEIRLLIENNLNKKKNRYIGYGVFDIAKILELE